MASSTIDTHVTNTIDTIADAATDLEYNGATAFVHDENANSPEDLMSGHSVTRRFAVLSDGTFNLEAPIGQVTEWAEFSSSLDAHVAYQIGRSSVVDAVKAILRDRDRLVYELTQSANTSVGLIRRQVTSAAIQFATDGGVALLTLSLALRYRATFA